MSLSKKELKSFEELKEEIIVTGDCADPYRMIITLINTVLHLNGLLLKKEKQHASRK